MTHPADWEGMAVVSCSKIFRHERAHLIGVATTRLSSALHPIGVVDSNAPDLATFLEMPTTCRS